VVTFETKPRNTVVTSTFNFQLSTKEVGIVIRQSIKGTLVNYLGVMLGIYVQFYIVAKYLDPEVIGLSKVLYEAAMLLSTFALLGSGSSGIRFFPFFKNSSNGNNGFLYYFLLFPVVGIVLMSAVYLLFQSPIRDFFVAKSPLFNDYFYYVLPLMAVLTFWTWSDTYANIHMRIAIPKAIREMGMRLMMLGIYVAYGLHFINITGLIVGFIVCYGICMISTMGYGLHIGDSGWKHDWKFITPDLRRYIAKYSGFLILSAASANIMSQLDLFMLSGVRNLYATGIYTIVVYMADCINMPSRSITAISSPLAAQAMRDGDFAEAQKLYRQVSVHQTLTAFLLLFFIWINVDNIYGLIPNGDKFAEGKWALLLLGFSRVLFCILNFGNVLISYSKYYYWTLLFAIFLTALAITTNYYLIPIYGLSGAALATLITSVLSYGFQQYVVQIKLRTNPFTFQHLKIAVVVAVLYALNLLIPTVWDIHEAWYLPIADGLMRSVPLVVLALVLVYQFRISEQINGLIDKYILRK